MTDFHRTEMTRFTADVELPTYIDAEGVKWVSNPDAARGYGYANGDPRQIDKMRTKTHADELLEGVHWVQDLGVDSTPKSVRGRGRTAQVFWSLKGLIRLGNWVRTATGIEFRDATEAMWERELSGQTAVGASSDSELLAFLKEERALDRQERRETRDILAQLAGRVQGAAQHAVVVNRRLDRLEAGEPADELPALVAETRMTALQFAAANGLPRERLFLQQLGSRAAKIGRAAGLDEQRVPHPLYPEGVHSWPRRIWAEAQQQFMFSDQG